MNVTVDIPANGAAIATTVGVFKHLRVTTAPVGFQISFDGSQWSNARQNSTWDKSQQKPLPEKFYVRALNGLATSIVFEYDTQPLAAQDTSVLDAPTFVFCNGGQPGLQAFPEATVLGDPGHGAWSWVSAAPVDIKYSNAVKIPGTQNGCRRKTITFIWIGATPVVITDKNGLVFLFLAGAAAYQPYSFDVSDDFYVCGVGGISNNAFYYNEIYYANAN